MSLWLESGTLVTVALGCGIVLLLGLLLTRRGLRRKRWFVAILLLGGAFGAVAPSTAMNMFDYCTRQQAVHVDCVPDAYDGPVWHIVDPIRHLWHRVRAALQTWPVRERRAMAAPASLCSL